MAPLLREQAVEAMMRAQRHRGPDDSGLTSTVGATLGMTRLAIIDPAHARQPMSSGRHVLVFNGAIYNYRELRGELRGRGWTFRTESDTEVLLAAYATWGQDCLPRLRGMFAFAIWDQQERRLFAARDGLGIKPLYYARLASGGLALASECRALLASGLVDAQVDVAAVGDYLSRFAIAPPRTYWTAISNLPPGHQLEVDATGVLSTNRWWRLPPHRSDAPRPRDYPTFLEGLRAQLEDTVRAHQVADVPLGAFLSGGLDSTALVALMQRESGARLKTFSVVFAEPKYSEAAPARAAAEALGTEHHEFVLTGARVAADLPRILQAFDQPTGDGINTYYASLAAREGGVKVALSGLGGDELFGGYPSFGRLPRLAALLPLWRCLPFAARQAALLVLKESPSSRLRKLADYLGEARDLHELASLDRRVLSEESRFALLSDEARDLALRHGPHHPAIDSIIEELIGADELQVTSAWELRTYMADILLRDSDVFSLAHSLELRVPYVDARLLSWLWPQPANWKFSAAQSKRSLADAVSDLLPLATRSRRKQGFTLPFATWMRVELRPFLEECFSPSSLQRTPWLSAPGARRLWQDFLRAQDPRAWSRVWTVAMLIAATGRRPTLTS